MAGLPRSLRWTERKILRHVIAPFRRAAGDVTIVSHLNLPIVVDNPRSGERVIPLAMPDLRPIAPDMLLIKHQSDRRIADKFAAFQEQDLIGADDDRTVLNLHNHHEGARLYRKRCPDPTLRG